MKWASNEFFLFPFVFFFLSRWAEFGEHVKTKHGHTDTFTMSFPFSVPFQFFSCFICLFHNICIIYTIIVVFFAKKNLSSSLRNVCFTPLPWVNVVACVCVYGMSVYVNNVLLIYVHGCFWQGTNRNQKKNGFAAAN